MGWRETNCVTQVRTPLQDLPCDAVIPGNLNKANSGFCECTYGNKNIVFGCGDPFEFATCNDACGYNEVEPYLARSHAPAPAPAPAPAAAPATTTTTTTAVPVIEEVMRTMDETMDDENGEFHEIILKG